MPEELLRRSGNCGRGGVTLRRLHSFGLEDRAQFCVPFRRTTGLDPSRRLFTLLLASLGMDRADAGRDLDVVFRHDYEHPLVPPHVSHLRHVPLRTRVKLPHSPQLSPS